MINYHSLNKFFFFQLFQWSLQVNNSSLMVLVTLKSTILFNFCYLFLLIFLQTEVIDP